MKMKMKIEDRMEADNLNLSDDSKEDGNDIDQTLQRYICTYGRQTKAHTNSKKTDSSISRQAFGSDENCVQVSSVDQIGTWRY